jgi:hypothetical protein
VSDSIVKNRKTWENVLRMVSSGEMPPVDKARPSARESEAFTQIVREIFLHADRNAKPDPGRVTMRRLNRVEYRNTVRDLIGVDFDPTEDFPSDDIGHGFDNIGDVLTLSPVLMERYLAASEGIVQRAITPQPPPVPKRHLSSRHAEPASKDVEKTLMEGKFRRMSSDAKEAIGSGPLHTSYPWVNESEYLFRTRVYAKSESESPIRIALMVQGKSLDDETQKEELESWVGEFKQPTKILKICEVTATKPEDANVFEVSIPKMVGRDRMLIAVQRPATEQPHVQVFVEYLSLDGPLDTRPASHRRLLEVSSNQSPQLQTQEVMSRFLRRAYRRTPTESEIARMTGFVDQAMSSGQKWEAAIQMAVQATLCSPKFLFRVELDDRPESNEARKLDEYLSSIRDIESRIEKAEKLPPIKAPSIAAPTSIPAAYDEHIRLMCDLIALGFQADVTRIATFVLANEGSNKPYPFIDVSEGHHDLSHHGNDQGKLGKIAQINTFHTKQLAYLLEKLDSISEGDGTLLDHSMIAYGSGNSDGNAHNHDDLPILLAGGGCGTLKTGRHIRYDKDTPLNNLWLSMLNRMQIEIARLGDSTGSLGKLDA